MPKQGPQQTAAGVLTSGREQAMACSTAIGAGLSSLVTMNRAVLPGGSDATSTGATGLGGVGMGAGMHAQAQLLEHSHSNGHQHLSNHTAHHGGSHHLGSSRAQHAGLESSAHPGNTSGQPWELQRWRALPSVASLGPWGDPQLSRRHSGRQ